MENDDGILLHPSEAAKRLGVDPKTLTRWANARKIPYIKTVGGHRRYYERDVNKIINSQRG